jgi:eukaryotic-like serine/threonine-protein kinase
VTLFLGALAALAAGLIASRLPLWLLGLGLALALAPWLGLVLGGGVGRGLAPLLVLLLGLGLALPANPKLEQKPRVAPARRKRRGVLGGKAAPEARALPGVDAVEIPGYDVLEKVGSGGMASVYRAQRHSDGQIVALKVPMEQYVADAKFIRRFHREAEVAQRLDHVNIVRTFEHGSVGVKHYMAMEYVDGKSLEAYIESKELSIELSTQVMRAVAQALLHIHSVGIIHRDIKPANIMILHGGVLQSDPLMLDPAAVKLMDFGIAGGKVLSRLTMTGARVGTPVYMSPEQARGLKIDHRSDIYSLGLVMYEALTGQTAFKGGYEAIVHQQIFQTPPPPRQLNLAIPKALDQLIMRMIAKDPDERPNLEEVVEVLGRADFAVNDETPLPSRIVLTVSSRQGVLRFLDTQGALHSSLGNIGVGEGSFSAAPLAVSLDTDGNIYAAIFEYRAGEESGEMIHKLDPQGRTLITFGAYGMKPGELLYPLALAVSLLGRVYVLDAETHMVQCFSTHGDFLFNFGGRGDGRGTFDDPRTLAVDTQGSLYVLDYGNRQVQRFSPDGHYQTRWAFKLGPSQEGMRLLDGFAVDERGNLYISDATGGKVRKISPEGKVELSYSIDPLQGEATDTLLDLGMDDKGFLYAARRGGHLIRKYDLAGRLVETLETYAPVVQMLLDVRVPVYPLEPVSAGN